MAGSVWQPGPYTLTPEVRLADADVAAQTATLGQDEAGSRPAEIAQAILFLADPDRSSYITGATLPEAVAASRRLNGAAKIAQSGDVGAENPIAEEAHDNARAYRDDFVTT